MSPSSPPTTELAERLAEARAFAVHAHGEQRYGQLPYVVHLDRVAALAAEYGLPDDYRVAAYLHDVLEDTTVTYNELHERFGIEVAALVDSVTGEGTTRADARASTLRKLARNPEHAKLKLMDRLANVLASTEEGRTDLLAMYRKELPAYAELFAAAHPEAYERLRRLLA